MTRYRCYFFGGNGQLVGAETIFSDSDNEARDAARRWFASRAYATSFELRDGSRLVDAQEARAS